MQILKFSLGQLQANCYFLIQDEECLIIDPADEASFILEELQRRKLNLVGVLATHGHFDHIMAAGEMQIHYVETRLITSLQFYINKNDLFLVKRLNETANYFLGYDPNALQPTKIIYLKAGKFHISRFTFQVLHTPGHTPGSSCFYFPHFASHFADASRVKKASRGEEKGIIFTGDTLFKQGIGRYDFSYSSKNDLKKSLKKILKLPKDTVIYPGHGENTTIDNEKEVALTLF